MSKMIHKPRSKGFTLIELMIVILIIAILVGIAVPVYLAAKRNAEKRTCQANLRTIEGAFNTYMADAEVYPGTMKQMTESGADYKVLKKEYYCPACGTTPYPVGYTDAATMPTTICPSSPLISGHEI